MRDKDIRGILLPFLNSKYERDSDTLIIEELGLCQGTSRIDLAVVNGSIHGYEIKSEKDTLIRLEAQQETYNKVLDYVTIVASPRHLEKITTIVPEWWGLNEANYLEGILHISSIRGYSMNPSIDPLSLVQLLWRDEALDVLREYGLHKGLVRKPRKVLWECLAHSLPITELRKNVREKIKARDNWRPA